MPLASTSANHPIASGDRAEQRCAAMVNGQCRVAFRAKLYGRMDRLFGTADPICLFVSSFFSTFCLIGTFFRITQESHFMILLWDSHDLSVYSKHSRNSHKLSSIDHPLQLFKDSNSYNDNIPKRLLFPIPIVYWYKAFIYSLSLIYLSRRICDAHNDRLIILARTVRHICSRTFYCSIFY